MSLPRVAVVFDRGAASPVEIRRAAREVCRPVFAFDPTQPHAVAAREVLEELGEVRPLDGDDGAAAEQLRRDGVEGIVTFSEGSLGRTARLAELLGLPHHPVALLPRLTSKSAQRAALDAGGLPQVRWRLLWRPDDVPEAVAAVGLPAVLKPDVGSGSRHTYRVTSEQECRELLPAVTACGGPAIIEEVLHGDPAWSGGPWGDYVSVESVTVAGAGGHAAIVGKLPLAEPYRETGMFAPFLADPSLCAEIERTATAALHAIGVRWGVTHTEIKLTPDGPRVIEVNGRLGGHVADIVHRAGGPDLVRLALQAALGRSAPITGLPGDRVAFQYFLAAPVGVHRIRSIAGLAEVRQMTEVSSLVVGVPPGSVVDHREGTGSGLAVVGGEVADHAALARLMATLRDQLVVDAEPVALDTAVVR